MVGGCTLPFMAHLSLAVALVVLLQSPAPARLVPPAPPTDLATLLSTDPATNEQVARRMLEEAGVPVATRLAAARALAKSTSVSPATVVLDALTRCGGSCGATRDLGDVLLAFTAEICKEPAMLTRLEAGAKNPQSIEYIASMRVIAALPKESRPVGLTELTLRTVALKTIPGAMQYDIKEIKAKPGEVLEITLENPDSLQHNLLIVAPGKMSEVGVAADKMGETVEGKSCQFVPNLPSVLTVMGLVDPGKTGKLWIAAPTKPGTYSYVCTYPGHWRMMNGKLKVAL